MAKQCSPYLLENTKFQVPTPGNIVFLNNQQIAEHYGFYISGQIKQKEFWFGSRHDILENTFLERIRWNNSQIKLYFLPEKNKSHIALIFNI